MIASIIVALISGGLALAGTIISNLTVHNKTMYRIEQLEKKQDKHNSLIERVYNIEATLKVMDNREKVSEHRIEDLERKEGE